MITEFKDEYRFLSNFWHQRIFINGKAYLSVEHYYQACKAVTEQDHEIIRNAGSAAIAKRFARLINMRSDWEQVKESFMLNGLREKFKSPRMRYLLLNTGEEYLVEGNTWGDTYWGVCNGIGQNRLGHLLMQVRKEIRDAGHS